MRSRKIEMKRKDGIPFMGCPNWKEHKKGGISPCIKRPTGRNRNSSKNSRQFPSELAGFF